MPTITAEAAMAMTISEVAAGHYLPHIEARRQPDTAYGYRSSIELHVLPRWGSLTLPEIDRDAVQEWVDALAKTDAGPGGAWKAYKCLRQIVNWMVRKWALYVARPTDGIEEPRRPAYRPETLTQRRLKRLIRGMVGCRYEATVILSAALGLRPGEAYYVKWEQVNWRTGLVPIRGSLQQVPGLVYESPVKTAKGERDLYLPAWALDRLHQLWVEAGRPRGRIIGTAKPSAVARAVRRWIEAHRLPKVTMRNLRHTWATLAATLGVTIELCAAMLGHTNVQTCYRYYYALTAAAAKRAQRRVARGVLGKTCEDMYKGIQLAPPEALPMAA